MSRTAGERRIVSVLVADVVGSTAIGERLGPERSKFLFDEVVALMREEVRRFDGTVAQLTGDGVLALFGAPLAHEDDAERAVRAALAIQAAIAPLRRARCDGVRDRARRARRRQHRPGGRPGRRGGRPSVLYNALGDTVNVAARLQALGDAARVGPETARQLAGGFELEPLGDVELKGKGDAVSPPSA